MRLSQLNGAALILALCVLISSSAVHAPGQCQRAKLTANDGAPGDWFGYAVDISIDVAVIGAPYNADQGHNYGAGYVFERSGPAWSQVDKLFPPEDGGLVGRSVAIDGDVIVLGTTAAWTSVYEYIEGVWTYVADLRPDEYDPPMQFGLAVDVCGTSIIVGEPEYDGSGANSGASYIFERDPNGNWPQVALLVPEGGAGGAEFGHDVAINGDIAVIGAWSDSDLGTWSGSAYVFERDPNGAWSQAAKLLASDGDGFDFFGSSVAASGNVTIVGAPDADGLEEHAGAAYVFERDPNSLWREVAKLTADDGVSWDGFGHSVAVDGDMAVIGAGKNDEVAYYAGATYVFVCDDGGRWSQVAKLTADDGAEHDIFGVSVGISGNTAIIGAYKDDDHGEDSGSAYVFAVGPDEDGDGIMDVCLCPGDLDGDLDIDLSDLAQLLSNYGATSGAVYEDGDLDEDGDVDLSDLAALLAEYGTICP